MSNIGIAINYNNEYVKSRIEGEGYDWIVIRYIDNNMESGVELVTFGTAQEKIDKLKEWEVQW